MGYKRASAQQEIPVTAVTQTRGLEHSSSVPLAERLRPIAEALQVGDCKLDLGARIGLCLGGCIFLLLAAKMVFDLLRAVLGW